MIRTKMPLTKNELTGEYYYADPKTGEILAVLKSNRLLDSITINTKSKQGFYDDHKDKFNKTVGFFSPFQSYGKLNLLAFEEIAKLDLTAFEMRLVVYFISRVAQKTCAIKKKRTSTLTPEDLEELFGVKKTTVYTALLNLRKHEIIHVGRGKKKKILLNPYIFFKGNTVEREIYELFKTTKWCKTK